MLELFDPILSERALHGKCCLWLRGCGPTKSLLFHPHSSTLLSACCKAFHKVRSGSVAVSISACHAEGRGFKSRPRHIRTVRHFDDGPFVFPDLVATFRHLPLVLLPLRINTSARQRTHVTTLRIACLLQFQYRDSNVAFRTVRVRLCAADYGRASASMSSTSNTSTLLGGMLMLPLMSRTVEKR